MNDGLMNAKEVRDYLKISESTLHRWRREGRLKGVRIGPRALRYRREDVEALGRGEGSEGADQ